MPRALASIRTVTVILAILFMACLTLLFVLLKAPNNHEPADLAVRLSWLHQAQFAGFYVAEHEGYYADEQLQVELLELDTNTDPIEELKDGTVQMAVMESHQMLDGINEGADLVAVMAIYQQNPHVLAAKVDSGIQTPNDFIGKTVGLAGGAAEGNTLFRIFLEQLGIADQIDYVELGFDSVADFKQNRADIIDVYRTDQPYLAQQEGIELTLIPLDAYGFATYGDVLVVERSYLDNHPDVVRRFVQATQQGWETALSNPERGIAATLPYTKSPYNDYGYQRHILEESTPLIRGAVRDLGRMETLPWSTLYETMRTGGVIERDIEISQIYTNAFIQ